MAIYGNSMAILGGKKFRIYSSHALFRMYGWHALKGLKHLAKGQPYLWKCFRNKN